MKILFFYLGSRGGGVNDFRSLLSSVAEDENTLFAINNTAVCDSLVGLKNVNKYFVDIPSSKFRFVLFVLSFRWIKVLKRIASIAPKSVVITMFHPLNFIVFIYKYLLNREVKIYIFLHNGQNIDVFNSWFDNIVRLLDIFYCIISDHIFVLSKAVGQYVEAHPLLKLKRSSYTGFGIYLSEFHHEHSEQFFAGGPISFIFFGKILPYKGLDNLTEALRMLLVDDYPFQCYILGEGEIRGDFLESTKIEYLNRWVSDHELFHYIERSHFGIFPYLHCSQSGALSTAFSCSLPVVVSNLPSFVEAVRDNGFGYIMQGSSASEIVSAIKHLDENRLALHNIHKLLVGFNKSNDSWVEVWKRMSVVIND